jgi:hypothetical protein
MIITVPDGTVSITDSSGNVVFANEASAPTTPPATITQDPTNALQQAFDALPDTSRRGGFLQLADHDVTLTRPIMSTNVTGAVIRGSGRSRFLWAGKPTDPMFWLQNWRNCTLEGFCAQVSKSSKVSEMFRMENAPAPAGTSYVDPGHNAFRGIELLGTDGGFQCGWNFCGVNGNNDMGLLENCKASDYTGCMVSLSQMEFMDHHFVNCQAYGYGGQSAVAGSVDGLTGSQGSYVWDGGIVVGHAVDFNIGGSQRAITLDHVNSEHSFRFLKTGGPTGAQQGLFIYDLRWEAEQLAADGQFMLIQHPGPIVLADSNNIGGQNRELVINWNVLGIGFPSFEISNCGFEAPKVTFAGKRPTSTRNSFSRYGEMPAQAL